MKVNFLPTILTFSISVILNLHAVFCQDAKHHPVVSSFEKFVDVENIDDAQRGSLLINELNCASCHASEKKSSWAVAAKQAPILSNVANRVRPEYLIKFLNDPHGTKPGTSMPDVLASRSEKEKNQISEALAHFLASTGKTSDTPPMPGPAANGNRLFHSIGCVACHNPQSTDDTFSTSVPLGDLDKKYTIPGLASFLQKPLTVRPSGRMPHLGLDGKEAQEIATYLLRDIKVQSNINVAVYHGSWDNLPNFDELKPASTGTVPMISPKVAGRNENFGLVFTGFWEVNKRGKYNFKLSSDDGSRLVINGKRVINNDGVHPNKAVSGSMELEVGKHEVRIEYFEKGGHEALSCEVNGPGLANQSFSGLLKATKEPPMNEDRFVLDESKAKLGAKYFVSVGCANCHEMKIDNRQLEPDFAAKSSMSDLRKGGCIDGAGPVPQFGFNDRQKESLAAALNVRNSAQSDRAGRIHQTLSTLNCYACHERNFVGGVVDRRGESDEVYGREKWFTSNQPEMGDEGRLPPFLNGVGAKLNPQWLEQVLDNNAKERPYMTTRMPRFGKHNLGELVEDLKAEDKLTDVIDVEFNLPQRKIKNIGKAFAGTSEKENGLSCIKCHTFANYRATGIQAISLTSMSKRLNKDWFIKYMLKPSRYRPGTRMPESWPGGQSFFPGVLDGDTNKQIAAIWTYLADGEKAAKPKGLIQAKMQLVASDAPKMYRNFIEGAGPRAIGVGYPEELNLAFDANNSRLAMIWTGAFIDASRHWTGRGQGFQPPLGDNVLKLPSEVAFAKPDVAEKEWPKKSGKELGLRFRGYKFNKDRQPLFNYQLDKVSITDLPAPHLESEELTFKRTFTLTADSDQTIWYRAAVGNKIQKDNNGTFSVGDDYKIRLAGDGEAVIRKAGSSQELILKIKIKKGDKAEFTQEYIW